MKLETIQYTKQSGWEDSLARSSALDSENTVVFIFGSTVLKDQRELFSEIEELFPQSVKIGCSGSGEIYGSHLYDESLAVAVARFERSRIRLATAQIPTMSYSYFRGYEVAEQLKEESLVGVFVLSDGLKTNGSELVRGMNAVLPGIIITGGLSGAGLVFKDAWVINEGYPQSGVIAALGIYGEHVHVKHGTRGGWDPFGPERIVTRSDQNILYELDGQPALQLYKEYLGERAFELPASALLFPLQIRSNEMALQSVVRTVLGIDKEKNALIFAGNIHQGSMAQLMMADFDRLIDGAGQAAHEVQQQVSGSECILTIAISCVGRRLVLGQRTEEEIDAIFKCLPKQARQIGFYANGEISPLVEGQNCELHNQTMTLTSLYEEAAL